MSSGGIPIIAGSPSTPPPAAAAPPISTSTTSAASGAGAGAAAASNAGPGRPMRHHGPEQENTDPTKPQGIKGSLRLLVPEKSMKLIIGPGGSNVKRIGADTGTFVNVSTHPFSTTDMCTDHIVSITPRYRIATFTSALHQCTSAKKAVMSLAFPGNLPGDDFKCIFLVDVNLAGLMIGKGGDRISAIRREFNVQVSLQKPPPLQSDEEVTFSGTLENVERAVCQLNDVFRVFYQDDPEGTNTENQQQQQNVNMSSSHSSQQQQQQQQQTNSGIRNTASAATVAASGGFGTMGHGKSFGGGSSSGWDCSAAGLSGSASGGKGGYVKNSNGGGAGAASQIGAGGSWGGYDSYYSMAMPMTAAAAAATGAGGGVPADSSAALSISSCPTIPIKCQQLRSAVIHLPVGLEPAAFIGKNGSFMKDLKSRCCVHGVGYIKRMHIGPCETTDQFKAFPAESEATSPANTNPVDGGEGVGVVKKEEQVDGSPGSSEAPAPVSAGGAAASSSSSAAPAIPKPEYRIDFLASEGIFAFAVAQILERFRQVERHMSFYESKSVATKPTEEAAGPGVVVPVRGDSEAVFAGEKEETEVLE